MRRLDGEAPAKASPPDESKPPRGKRRSRENLTGEGNTSNFRLYTAEDTRKHMMAIEQLLLQGRPENGIVIHCKERYDIGRFRVRRLINRIRETWEQADKEMKGRWRSEQLRQLEHKMSLAGNGLTRTKKQTVKVGRRTKEIEVEEVVLKPNLNAWTRMAELRARITGTLAPVEVHVDIRVHDALTDVLANLGSEQVQGMVDEYLRTKALAAKAEAVGLLPDITVNAESAAE